MDDTEYITRVKAILELYNKGLLTDEEIRDKIFILSLEWYNYNTQA